jgi:hypothetical protein
MHEVIIRGGGKTVHVVFKYLKEGRRSNPGHLHPFSRLLRVDISNKNDVTVILLLDVSLMLLCLFGCHSATGLFFYVTRCLGQGENWFFSWLNIGSK